MVREIPATVLVEAVRQVCLSANIDSPSENLERMRCSLLVERSPMGRGVLEQLLENAELARSARVPLCQDTGTVVLFVDVGSSVVVTGGGVTSAINEGVRRAYRDGHFRMCIERGPLDRVNTDDNTPAVVTYEIVDGEGIDVTALIKGGGCDNMSALRMFTPAHGIDDVRDFVVSTVESAGPNASPPVTIGVGIGGTFAKAAQIASRALARPGGGPHPVPALAALEDLLLEALNRTGIGPAGYGGDTTALAVHVESFPTHDSSFPVAVNIDCHSHRVDTIRI